MGWPAKRGWWINVVAGFSQYCSVKVIRGASNIPLLAEVFHVPHFLLDTGEPIL